MSAFDHHDAVIAQFHGNLLDQIKAVWPEGTKIALVIDMPPAPGEEPSELILCNCDPIEVRTTVDRYIQRGGPRGRLNSETGAIDEIPEDTRQ